MNKSPRLAPLFVALSVLLSALPQAALAQGSLRTAAAPAEISAANTAGIAALPNAARLGSLNAVVAPVDLELATPALAPAAAIAAPETSIPLNAAVSAETAASAEASARVAAPSAVMSAGADLLGRLRTFVGKKISALSLFDNGAQPAYARGFQGGLPPLELPDGVKLDAKPLPPLDGAHEVSKHAAPAGALMTHSGTPGGFSLVALDADPRSPASIEAALRKLIDDNPRQYKIASNELGKVHVEKVHVGDLADPTYHAVFRQMKTGTDDDTHYAAAVSGAYISFVIKVVGGKAMLVPEATSAKLYPEIRVAMTPKFSDAKLQDMAHKRLRPKTAAGFAGFHIKKAIRNAAAAVGLASPASPVFITREVIYGSDKKWHTANLYSSPDQNVVALAVDVATGKTFAWDGRVPLRNAAPVAAPANANVVFGLANTDPTGTDNDVLGNEPMPFMKVKDAKGAVIAVTDENGLFSLNADGSDPIQVTISLDNVRSHVVDQNKKNPAMTIKMTVVPGKSTQAIFPNPGNNPELVANINGLLYSTNHIEWFQNVIGLDRLKGATIATIKTNVNQACNAFYQPSDNTLNLFAKSAKCENTAQPSVIQHETGHWVLQMHSRFSDVLNAMVAVAERATLKVFQPVSAFVDDTTNENFADFGAISHGGNPNLGNGFTLATPDQPLRTGLGMDKYDPSNDDPHQPAQMQFWYQSQVALVQAGYAALDVQRLILSTVAHNLPGDVQTAVTQVVLAFMKDGVIPQPVLAILQRVAQDHTLPWNGIPPTPPAAKK